MQVVLAAVVVVDEGEDIVEVVVVVEVVDEGEDIVQEVVVVSLLEDGMGSALGVMAMATGQATLLDNGHHPHLHIHNHCLYHGRVYRVVYDHLVSE